jgi:hypothetical protein
MHGIIPLEACYPVIAQDSTSAYRSKMLLRDVLTSNVSDARPCSALLCCRTTKATSVCIDMLPHARRDGIIKMWSGIEHVFASHLAWCTCRKNAKLSAFMYHGSVFE